MNTYYDGPELRPHDEQCERKVCRGRSTCRCHHRFRDRSTALAERPVQWPWLHGRAPEQGAEAS